MAFLPNIERYFNSNATLDQALNSELQHKMKRLKGISEGQLSKAVNAELLSFCEKIFQNQKTLMVPEDNRFTQHYINMSQYFYDLLMHAIENNTTDSITAAKLQEKARRKLFFSYKKVAENEEAFYLGCSLIADTKKVVTRHFVLPKTEIFILTKDVMKNFIEKNHRVFSIFFPVNGKPDTYNGNPLFEHNKFQILLPIIYELLGETRVFQLQRINGDFEIQLAYGLEEDDGPATENDFALRCYVDEHGITRYFSRNNTNPAFIEEIERFYEENTIYKNLLMFLRNQKENATYQGKQLLNSLGTGDYFIYPALIKTQHILEFFFKKNRALFDAKIARVDLSGEADKLHLLQSQLKDLIDKLNNTVKYMHATAGKFEVIDIGRDGKCGWNSIIWCIYGEKEGDADFLNHRNQLIETYVEIRENESLKEQKLFQKDSPIESDAAGDEYRWQIKHKVSMTASGHADITWDNHTNYLRLENKTSLFSTGEDIQNVLACLGLLDTQSEDGSEYRNRGYIQEGDEVENMVTLSDSHNAEYDWTFKIINTGAHWEVMQKKDEDRVNKAREYLKRAFRALVKNPREYDPTFSGSRKQRRKRFTEGMYSTRVV